MTDVDIIMLCDIYGALLTERQRTITRLYYDYDNSLAEIAEQLGITRQAVKDALSKGVEALVDYESKLNFLEKKRKLLEVSENIKNDAHASVYADDIRKILGD